MKPFVIAFITLALLHPTVEAAQNNAAQQKAVQQRMDAQKKEREKEKAERDKRREAVQRVLDAKDKNHDGSLSKDEYIAGEADPVAAGKKFDEFDKNKDHSLSKSEIADSLGLGERTHARPRR